MLSAASASAEYFSFVRKADPSDSFQCSILSRQSSRYSFHIPGSDAPVVKLNSVEAVFFGFLTVRQVNPAGNPVRLSIRADRFSGSIDGRTVNTGLPQGARIEADLAGGKAVFSRDGKLLPHDVQSLLGTLFPPASDHTIADLAGKSRSLPEPGNGWKPELKPFIDMLARRGVRLAPNAFRSGITYHGTERVGKLQCRRFSLLIETAKLADYDCRFKMTFSMAPSGPPVSSVREVTEVIRQVMHSSRPFVSGTKIELVNQDHTERSLIPVPAVPPPKAPKKPAGAWETLLH